MVPHDLRRARRKDLNCTTRRPAKPKQTHENASLPTLRAPEEELTETIPRAQPAQNIGPNQA